MAARTYRQRRRWQIKHADCLLALPKLDAQSIDAIITDPPYGINFNGMPWDRPARLDPARVPGQRRHAGTNPNKSFQDFCTRWASTCLRIMKPGAHLVAFASPKTAHLLACGLEKAGLELRDTLMWIQGQGFPAARKLPNGRGCRLKPAYEPILLARSPIDGTLDKNLVRYGTGALHIDRCRISANERNRWPANLILSHSQKCTSQMCKRDCPIKLLGEHHRFFYCAKPNRREREAGCEQLPRRTVQTFKIGAEWEQRARHRPVANIHPTVKPIELMRWLVRLITPPRGLVLDPFTGSGSTGAAAILEGARFLGIEREQDYIPIAQARIKYWARAAAGSERRPGRHR
ncbi:MAG TPA: site-specific DNA-methyltransferase [Solirubrobacteraceae bacterium]|jgi:DNA modification methylase|nr:site-specific DNA-methyltransferase [Solirubrobacteraceae bacterium]